MKILANNNLSLKYDDFSIIYPDGAFAQLQRKIAIYSIANFFRCRYIDTKITDITVTPLDNFQSKKSLKNQIKRVNSIFIFDGQKALKSSKNIRLPFLNLKIFIKFYLFTFITRKSIQLNISNPYPIIEKLNFIYKFKPKMRFSLVKKNPGKKLISIHIRRGVNSSHITPGELEPRTLPETYYSNLLKSILKTRGKKDKFYFEVFTDAPARGIKYKPLSSQTNRYNEFEMNKGGSVSIEPHGFLKLYATVGRKNLKVYRGGDPIDAFLRMVQSDILVMSKSSLSSVAALYCDGEIYSPPNFWHRPLSGWKVDKIKQT